MKRGVERAFADSQGIFGYSLDVLGDTVAVTRAAGKGAENEHVESAGEEVVSHRLSMEALCEERVKGFSIGKRWERLRLRLAGDGVDFFYEGKAAAAFAAVADWLRVVGDGEEEVFEDGFVAADVGYGRGGGA